MKFLFYSILFHSIIIMAINITYVCTRVSRIEWKSLFRFPTPKKQNRNTYVVDLGVSRIYRMEISLPFPTPQNRIEIHTSSILEGPPGFLLILSLFFFELNTEKKSVRLRASSPKRHTRLHSFGLWTFPVTFLVCFVPSLCVWDD